MGIIVKSLIRNVNSKKIAGKNLLDEWLNHLDKFADKICIADNMSDDGTFEKCQKHPKVVIERSDYDFVYQEQWIQGHAWDIVNRVAKEGDWVFVLDSDEFVDEAFLSFYKEMIAVEIKCNYFFPMRHMWNLSECRTGKYWAGGDGRLFPYQQRKFKEVMKEGLHNGGIPQYAKDMKKLHVDINIYHYGYHTEELRKAKSEFYKANINGNRQGDLNVANSILEDAGLVYIGGPYAER